MNVLKSTLVAGAAALALAAPAANASVTFSGTWSVDANTTDPGLVVSTDPNAGVFSETLAVGQSVDIFLFDLWTPESDVGGDDQVAQPIEVEFDLSSPASGGTTDGTTDGVRSGFFGIVQFGELDWNNPYTFNFGANDSGSYSISLTEGTFNEGLFGLNEGRGDGIGVSATLTYDVAAVPLPAGGAALGLALLGAAAYRRQQKKRRAA